jgi:hypothetical protein
LRDADLSRGKVEEARGEGGGDDFGKVAVYNRWL